MFRIPLLGVFAFLGATPAQTSGEERKPDELVEVEIVKNVKMKFCRIPAGEAHLGSRRKEQDYVTETFDSGRRWEWMDTESESVRGKFKTSGFWMAKYLVMQGEWEAVMGHNPSWFSKGGGGKDEVAGIDTSRFPVERVSWDDCQDFLNKLNKGVKLPALMGKGRFALPDEDQWEYACRGGMGNKRPFYFGDELNGTQANVNGSRPYGTTTKGPYLKRPTEVGSYEKAAPHPWGLCDMCGNLSQWCENSYNNGSRALRSGSWYENPSSARSAYRPSARPDIRNGIFGFRVVVIP